MERSQRVDMEIAERQEKFAILESTEGFVALTERQKRLIKASLYIQARTERAYHPKKESLDLLDKTLVEKYRKSLNIITDLNCHTSLLSLEAERVLFMDVNEIPLRFYDAEYFNPSSLKEVESITEKFGFPCIGHIDKLEEDDYEGEEYPQEGDYHSFLVLGHYKDEIITWDKEGFYLPFRLISLKEEYSSLNGSHQYHWGFRKLRDYSGRKS